MMDALSLWHLFKDSTALQAVLGALIGFLVMQFFQQRKAAAAPNLPMDERFMPGYRGGGGAPVPLPSDLPFGPATKRKKKQQKQQDQKQTLERELAAKRRAKEMERKLLDLMEDDDDGESNDDAGESERDPKQRLRRKISSEEDSGSRSDIDEDSEEVDAEAVAMATSTKTGGKSKKKKSQQQQQQLRKRGDARVNYEEAVLDDDEEATDKDEDADSEPDRDMVPYANVSYPPAEMLDRAGSFLELMRHRRSCRQFSDRPIDAELVRRLVAAAGTSPSGAHTEPWTYVVVTDRLVKRRIREIVEEEEEINYARRMGPTWKADLARFRTNWEKPYLTEAPVIVVLMRQVHGYRRGQEEKQRHYYSEISVSISAGLFLAAVQNVGLCTLTSTPMNAGPALRRLLGRPPNEKVHLLMPLGYAAEDAEVPDLSRKPLDRIMVSM